MKQVTLIGVGQIGASIGLGLKSAHGKKYRVIGYDPDQDIHARAEKIGAVDSAEWNLDVAVRDADVVVISVPVTRAYEMLETIAPYVNDHVTITDTCSTKRSILRWAQDLLPQHASFVGGHPLVKADATGRDEPSPYLFTHAPYAIIPHPRSRSSAVRDVQEICNDLGARPLFMDPDEHDSFFRCGRGCARIRSRRRIERGRRLAVVARNQQIRRERFRLDKPTDGERSGVGQWHGVN